MAVIRELLHVCLIAPKWRVCYFQRISYKLVKVSTESDWREYHSLRRRVLWEGRGRNGYDDRHADEYLFSNHHCSYDWMCAQSEQLVSTISEMAAVR